MATAFVWRYGCQLTIALRSHTEQPVRHTSEAMT